MSTTAPRPVLVSFCSEFLRRDMLHAYRQIHGIESFDHWVLTRNREHAQEFPFPQVVTLRKARLRIVHRLLAQARRRTVSFTGSEIRQMLRFNREHKVSVAHIYLGNVAAKCLKFLAREPAARVVSFHGGDLSDSLSPGEFREIWANADMFLARSRSLAEAMQERGCPPDRIRLNPTGIPLPEHFTPKAPRPGDQPKRLLQACRLIEKKGLEVTLQATAILARSGCRVALDLAGVGPEEAKLRALASELGISGQVRFLGFLPNIELLDKMPEYDAFVHPSRTTSSGDREGIPNSMLEAMARGVPVVATRHSGIPEAVVHGENGLLIDQAEPQALAQAIVSLFADSGLAARISLAAHKTISERFSIAACVRTLESNYREAMAWTEERRRAWAKAA